MGFAMMLLSATAQNLITKLAFYLVRDESYGPAL